jgi:Endoplasmic reticulum vesicle transporter
MLLYYYLTNSHTIHSMSFGDRYPNMPQNPLDGVTRIVDEDAGTGLMQVKTHTETLLEKWRIVV